MRFTAAVLLAVMSAACATSRATDEQVIRAALADWAVANNAGDQARANQIWAPGVQGWFPSGEEFRNTAAAQIAGASAEQPARSTFELNIEEVLVSGNLAVVRDTWRETRHFGAASAKRTIKSFEVWQRQPDGKWRISRWISTPDRWVAAR